MRRRLNVLWVPLLAAFLAGLPARQPSVGETVAAVGRVDAAAPATGLPRTAIRLQATQGLRFSIDRHGPPPGTLAADGQPSAAGAARPVRLDARDDRGVLPSASRRFPLFPTGPPQHS